MAVEAQSPVETMSHTEVFQEIGVWRLGTESLTKDVFEHWWMLEHCDPCQCEMCRVRLRQGRKCECFWDREARSHEFELCTTAWQLSFVSRHMKDSAIEYGGGWPKRNKEISRPAERASAGYQPHKYRDTTGPNHKGKDKGKGWSDSRGSWYAEGT